MTLWRIIRQSDTQRVSSFDKQTTVGELPRAKKPYRSAFIYKRISLNYLFTILFVRQVCIARILHFSYVSLCSPREGNPSVCLVSWYRVNLLTLLNLFFKTVVNEIKQQRQNRMHENDWSVDLYILILEQVLFWLHPSQFMEKAIMLFDFLVNTYVFFKYAENNLQFITKMDSIIYKMYCYWYEIILINYIYNFFKRRLCIMLIYH